MQRNYIVKNKIIMNLKLYFTIALRIILLMSFGFLISYITPNLRTVFDDKLSATPSGMDANYDWGVRHYWYFTAMVLLFILSCIDFICAVVNGIKKYYNTNKW